MSGCFFLFQQEDADQNRRKAESCSEPIVSRKSAAYVNKGHFIIDRSENGHSKGCAKAAARIKKAYSDADILRLELADDQRSRAYTLIAFGYTGERKKHKRKPNRSGCVCESKYRKRNCGTVSIYFPYISQYIGHSEQSEGSCIQRHFASVYGILLRFAHQDDGKDGFPLRGSCRAERD